MGPSLDSIQNLQREVTSQSEKIPELRQINLPPEEVFRRITENGGSNDLKDGIKDYNRFHGESAVLLYISVKKLF